MMLPEKPLFYTFAKGSFTASVSTLVLILVVKEPLGLVYRLIFWKHKNMKTYLSCPNIPEKYSTPSGQAQNYEIHSFTHTFCTKLKQPCRHHYHCHRPCHT
jgi:hypothetical protein